MLIFLTESIKILLVIIIVEKNSTNSRRKSIEGKMFPILCIALKNKRISMNLIFFLEKNNVLALKFL